MADPEDIRQSSDAVVSDMRIGASNLTVEEFATMLNVGSAVGYDNFRTFINGDYEYDKALYKGVLTSRDATARIVILTSEVDLPDIFDRGSAIVPTPTLEITGKIFVPFNRTFTEVTEVLATIKNGTVPCVPNVTNITDLGFDLEILDMTNARVGGTVSWSAKGY